MTNRYTKTAVTLHWLIALGIFGMFLLGWYMTDLPKEAPKQLAFDVFDWGIYSWQLNEPASPRTFYFNLHKSIGITILALIFIRVLWRITHKPPSLLSSYKNWEKKLATGAHHLLYLLMLAVPISGLIMSISSKFGVKWFGLSFIGGIDNDSLRHNFEGIHEFVGIVLLVVITIHILGALKHRFIDKDETLNRMMP